MVLDEAVKLGERAFYPSNKLGDAQGCRFENGQVKIPEPPQINYDAVAARAADAVAEKMKQSIQGTAGVVQRKAQRSLENILLSTSTGNPYIDGLIGMIPADQKKAWVRQIATQLRKSGLDNLFAETGESPSNGPAPSSDGLGPEWI
jgi:hypothetical protein